MLYTDYIVVGGGVAGLACALQACKSGTVWLLTKEELPAGSTPLAQGGIAAAIGPKDSPESHLADTLQAGCGICNVRAVEILVQEGLERVKELMNWGFPYDKDAQGKPLLQREGAHSTARVISAGGDTSGRMLAETLMQRARNESGIVIREGIYVVDLLMEAECITGVIAFDRRSQSLVVIRAGAVVLATGGCGQIFAHTTNALPATGDGFALAYRAGAQLNSMEFVQFHPTALCTSDNPMTLVSEAVRGRGALLINDQGERFMCRHHRWGELAPRDVVARAVYAELKQGHQVFLDATPIGTDFPHIFPTIHAACQENGINPPDDMIPIAPAAHFIMGGIATDLDGRTNVPGLYACGEVACTGIHGANRLASNSLLEGLVFGYRTGRAIKEMLGSVPIKSSGKPYMHAVRPTTASFQTKTDMGICQGLRDLMWEKVGIIRSQQGLCEALSQLQSWKLRLDPGNIALGNMITVAQLVTEAALARQESRGSHYRSDFPLQREPAAVTSGLSR
ncbi:MAG: L-aspartate oxidase [Firmicutes bacterium]|nr:L-aspartate oxidase [Bacillota bacterium]